jgi:DNA modification methylase
MKIEQRAIETLIPYINNSRKHSDSQVAQIAASIKEFGWTNPVLVDGSNGLIAGHGRLMAARKLEMDKIPVIELAHLSENQKKALIIADNKLALNSDWDTELLTLELQDLLVEEYDLDLLGFDKDELDALLNVIEGTDGLTDEDAVPEVPDEPKTKLGDIYILGNHRLMCGDSTSIDAVEKLMDGKSVDMVYTDPPYGISIVNESGHVGGEKLAQVGTYAPVANDDSIDVAVEAIQTIKTLEAKVEIIWGGNYYANYLENSSCWIVWDKQNTGNFADAELAWTNQKTAVRIFQHMWNGMIKGSEKGQKRVHPTQKPIALAEWCYEQYGKECETVLDLFAGSGSSLIACETKKKQGFMMELSPAYCDVIVKRWQDFTGKQAILETQGVESIS